MSRRKGFRLPPSKLTSRPGGKRRFEYVHRGPALSSLARVEDSLNGAKQPNPSVPTHSHVLASDMESTGVSKSTTFNEMTCYEIESRASVSGWERVRKNLMEVVVEAAAMPSDQCCIACEAAAHLICRKCGPLGFYCIPCFEKAHCVVNFLHTAEKWEVDQYVPYMRNKIKIDVRPQHICGTKKESQIECIDEDGNEHCLLLTSCECEALAITLVRAEMWPATPSNPKCAFSFGLLDRAEGLLMEAQVSLKDFCDSLRFRRSSPELKKRNIYSNLIDSFEEFRFLRHKLRNMKFLDASVAFDSGNVCPACPKVGGKVILSMDALFGLPRKRSAGVSHRDPLLKDVFFHDQLEVDKFVIESDKCKQNQESCSNLQAGNVLRSTKRYCALDETAVFGYCCRHEFPGKFLNLKHGERLAYGIFTLEKIAEKIAESEVFVMYDIACSLNSHLQKLGRMDILDSTTICLPTFHCYGHKLSCQIKYSPRRCLGIGLSDGEGMERLWSLLRRFSRMTKEMRPSHRIDILSGALEHYGLLKKRKLAFLLLIRWDRCKASRVVAEELLHDLMPNYNSEKEADILKWMDDETAIVSNHTATPRSIIPQWKMVYFQYLQTLYHLRLQVSSEGLDVSAPSITDPILSVERILLDLEKKHKIKRWLPSDPDFEFCKKVIHEEKMEQLLQELINGSQRRLFLIQMKAKYADGQKIAKKSCRQISKETRELQSLLKEINNVQQGEPICLAEAFDPAALKLRLQSLGMEGIKTTDLFEGKREIIQAYLMVLRSMEEMELLLNDAKNVVAHYSDLKLQIMGELENTSRNRGTKALLQNHLKMVEEFLHQAHQTVQTMANSEPSFPTFLDNDSNSDSSISDYD